MADGAMKQALGQGLMSFGQNLGGLMEKNREAERRRQESLAHIKLQRQMQLSDRAYEEDQWRRRQEIKTDTQRDLLRDRNAAYMDRLDARGDQQMEQLERRAELSRGGEGRSPLGRRRPEAYTLDSRKRFLEHFRETGIEDDSLLERAPDEERLRGLVDDMFSGENYGSKMPPVEAFIENQPRLAEMLEITKNTPYPEALSRAEDYMLKRVESSPGAARGGQGTQGESGLMGLVSPETATGGGGGVLEGGLMGGSVMDQWSRGEAAGLMGDPQPGQEPPEMIGGYSREQIMAKIEEYRRAGEIQKARELQQQLYQ